LPSEFDLCFLRVENPNISILAMSLTVLELERKQMKPVNRVSREDRKREATRPLYLTRYE
jgi:hypothetical protein